MPNPTVEASGNFQSAPSSNVFTNAFTVGANSNRILVVNVGYERSGGSDVVSSITYNGVALTQSFATSSGTGAGSIAQEIWYLIAPATGAHNIVVNLVTTNLKWVTIGAVSVKDAGQVAPDQMGTGIAASGSSAASISCSATSSDPLALCFALVVHNNSIGPSAPSAPTILTTLNQSAAGKAIGAQSDQAYNAISSGVWPGGTASPGWTINRGSTTYGYVIGVVGILATGTTVNVDTTTIAVTTETVAPQIQTSPSTTNFAVTSETVSPSWTAPIDTTHYTVTPEGITWDITSPTTPRGGRIPPGKYDWGHRNK